MAERRKPSRWRRAGRPDVEGRPEARFAEDEVPGENPYVGARPFKASESALFFGRAREQRRLAALIVARRSVLLYAQSGAGKTSLVQAGLVPHLQETKGTVVLPLGRVGGDLPPGIKGARVGNIYVFNTLVNMLGEKARPQEMLDLSLSQGLETYLGLRSGAEGPVLLVLDQFEELFTSHSDRYPERAGFFGQLRTCLDQYAYLNLLLTLREDYLAQLDAYAGLMPDRLRARFRMERLGYSAALSAVEEPAWRSGRFFGTGVAEALVTNLAGLQDGAQEDRETKAADNGTAPLPQDPDAEGVYVEPVHLQIVCQQLWDKVPADQKQIRAEDVERFGDVDQALADLYQEALDEVIELTDIGEHQLRAWFAPPLITPVGTRGLVYRDEGAGETQGLPNQAVDLLYDGYVIRAVKRGDDTWYELAHDRLVEPILEANRAWELEQAKQRPPEILSFEVDPWLIEVGHEVTLTWHVEGADELLIQPLRQKVPASGSMSDVPEGAAEYWLEAAKDGAWVAESERRKVEVGEPREYFWPVLLDNIEDSRLVPVIGSALDYDFVFGNAANPSQAWADEFDLSFGDGVELAYVGKVLDTLGRDRRTTRYQYLRSLRSQLLSKFEAEGGTPPAGIRKEGEKLAFSELVRGLDPGYAEAEDTFLKLASLPLDLYLTTSYHEFMEDALRRQDRRPRTVVCEWRSPSSGKNFGELFVLDPRPTYEEPVVYHFCGLDKDPSSLVLSEDDYLDFLAVVRRDANSVIPINVIEEMEMGSLLFLGFDLEGWEFRALLHALIRPLRLERWGRLNVFQSEAQGKSRDTVDYVQRYLATLRIDVYWAGTVDFLQALCRRWALYLDEKY